MDEFCTLKLNITKVGTAGSSSGSSSGTAGAGSGPYNHAYVTLQHSVLTKYGDNNAYPIGYRAGPDGIGLPFTSKLKAESGTFAKGSFRDYEQNPSSTAMNIYHGDCSKLGKAFQNYIDKVNKEGITYSATSNNSNAFIYSMLKAAGVNADSFTERINNELGRTGFLPGWGTTLPLN